MKSFLLLILPLMTGCEASHNRKEGWVEFTCKYPNPNEIYQSIEVEGPGGIDIRSTLKDVWETKNSVSLYHDTKSKQLSVVVKRPECIESGEYECEFKGPQSSDEEEVKVHVEKFDCQGKIVQAAYRTAKTTIKCDYPANEDKTSVKFFCKENNGTCESILSTKSSQKSNGTFSLTETDSAFKVSISNVSSHDAGVYWCGVEKENYRAGLRIMQLEVQNITTLRMSPTIGQNLTFMCEYPNGTPIKKFICKGEDPSVCTPLVSTSSTNKTNKTNGKFFLKENEERTNLTITVREVTTNDTGTYWCGAESNTRSNPFVHRLEMTVVPPPTLTTSILSSTLPSVSENFVSSTQSSGSSPGSTGRLWSPLIIAVVVCGVVLVLLFVLFLVYKQLEHIKSQRNEGKLNNKDDGAYEEIQELPQKSDSGTAHKTIYVTANFSTNPSSPSHHYSTINFQNSSVKGSSDTYCSVRDSDKPPAYSTVNHPAGDAEDPFYSTVKQPQQH